MVPCRRRGFLALALLTLALAAIAPPLSVQGQASTFCDNTGNSQPIPDAIERHYDDLIVDVQDVRLRTGGGASEPAEAVGAHFLTDSTGTLTFKVDVRNVGHGTGGPTGPVNVRVSVGQPNGAGLVYSLPVDMPARGRNTTVATAVDLVQEGRHTLQLHVNPERSITEECHDPENTANTECPSGSVPGRCSFQYYDNNTKTYGLLIAARPDLVVTQITAVGPTRATAGDSPDAEVTLRATIQNIGSVRAYNLAALAPGAATFPVTLGIEGCTCTPATVQVDSVPADGSKTVEARLKAHGLSSTLTAVVTIDPPAATGEPGLVHEADETNNAAEDEFPIPTADLVVTATHELETVDGRIVVPKGHPLEFTVNVQNLGDARAAKTNGDGFRLIGSRDSPANPVLIERFGLDGHSSVSFRVREEAQNLTANHDFKILVDDEDAVIEANEDNNEYIVRVTVALFEVDLTLTEAAATPTVPPGIAARVPFELTNKGTVADTLTLTVPIADQSRTTFVDATGNVARDITLAKGATFKGELRYEIPQGAIKGETYATTLQVLSAGSGNLTTRDITFTVGDDTVAPTVSLEDPKSGYLSGNKVVIRVTDNVNVSRVESDVSGSFVSMQPDTPGGSLYTIDVTGRPASFKINIRATDTAGNEATKGFDLVRDTTAPRIASVDFTPARGVLPGTKVTTIVDARDENLKEVLVTIRQPRPDGLYRENHTLLRTSANFQLRDWVVPERAGHYVFNVTAIDHAGNRATREATLIVLGFDVRVPQNRFMPVVSPAAPSAGDLVRFTWFIENTSPLYETGPMFVAMAVDAEHVEGDTAFIGGQRVNLGPGEVRPVTFAWTAAPGKHFFTFVIDQRLEVAEADETNNAPAFDTASLFGDHRLFASLVEAEAGTTFGDRLVDYWFIPVLFVATVVLFVVAIALGRRTVA